jgi:hypothetical protein
VKVVGTFGSLAPPKTLLAPSSWLLAPVLLSQRTIIQVPLGTLHRTKVLHFHLHLMFSCVIAEDLDLERLVELECIPAFELFLLVIRQRVWFACLELLPFTQPALVLKPDGIRGHLHRGAFLDFSGKGTDGKSKQEQQRF